MKTIDNTTLDPNHPVVRVTVSASRYGNLEPEALRLARHVLALPAGEQDSVVAVLLSEPTVHLHEYDSRHGSGESIVVEATFQVGHEFKAPAVGWGK